MKSIYFQVPQVALAEQVHQDLQVGTEAQDLTDAPEQLDFLVRMEAQEEMVEPVQQDHLDAMVPQVRLGIQEETVHQDVQAQLV